MTKITIGGQERTLYFEKMGFLKHLGEVMEADPLDILGSGFSTDPGKAYKVNLAIIYAGMLTECDVLKATPAFTKEDVDKWVSVLDISELKDLVLNAFAAITGKTVDELKKAITQAETQEQPPA